MASTPITEWTSYRRKYGLASDMNLYGFEGAGKSLLTPLVHQSDKEWPFSMEEYEDYKRLEKYQRDMLTGYTTAELIAAGALPSAIEDEDLGNFGGDLGNEIHPVFDRKGWLRRDDGSLPKNLAFFMIGHGKEGYWDAWNDDVWEVLKPILRLATQLLSTVHLLPWFDAMLQGDLKKFTGDYAEYKHFLKFEARRPDIAYENREATHRLIMQWGSHSEFHISHGGLTMPGTAISHVLFHGMAIPEEFQRKDIVLVAFHLLEALMFHDLNKAEKLMIQYVVATTIVHELCHALFTARVAFTPGLLIGEQHRYEPFFENEPVQELGESMTAKMLGGYSIELLEQSHINYSKSYPPPLATCAIPWPSGFFADATEMEEDPQSYFDDRFVETDNTLTTWLVPAIFFHHIQQRGFWETHVNSYGAEALWPMRSISKREGCEVPTVYHSIANLALKHKDAERGCIAQDIFQRAKDARIAIEYHLQKRAEDEERAQQEPGWVPNLEEEDSGKSMDWERATDEENDNGFDEFIRMIKTFQFELALDTHKRVSEHIFLDYINRTCGRLVDRDDFRRFMRICNQRKVYFRLEMIPDGADFNGIVRVRDLRHFGHDAGGPRQSSTTAAPNPAIPDPEASRVRSIYDLAPNPAAPNPAAPNPAAPNQAAPNQAAPNPAAPNQAAPNPAAPNPSAQEVLASAGLIELVKECIKRHGDQWGSKSHDWHDTDLDVRSILNYAIKVHRIHRPDLPHPADMPVNEFGKFLLDHFGNHFARGPEGVIRWIYKPKSKKRNAPEKEEGSGEDVEGRPHKIRKIPIE